MKLGRAELKLGLGRMRKDGSFSAIFQKYDGCIVAQTDLKMRQEPNHILLLPKESPAGRVGTWFACKRCRTLTGQLEKT